MKKLLVTLAGIVMALTPTIALISCSVPKLHANQKQLSFVIKQTDLGEFNNKELNTDLVISKIYDLNPGAYADLKEALKDLVLDLNTKVLTSNGIYEGSVQLTWTQNTDANKTLLSSVITEKKLGEIKTDNLTSDLIIGEVIKLNPGAYANLDEAIADLIVNEETKTITSRDKYDGWVTLTWTISSEGQQPGPGVKEQLSSVIVNPNLNARADIEVNEETLIKKVYFLNPGAYTNEQAALADLKLDLASKVLTSNGMYEGSVTLSWTQTNSSDKALLASVIINNHMDLFTKENLTTEKIISNIYTLNPKAYPTLDAAKKDLIINIATQTITSRNDYDGWVQLTWLIEGQVPTEKIDLEKVIIVWQFGQLVNDNHQTIFEEILAQNPITAAGLTMNDITILFKEPGISGSVVAKESSLLFTGEMPITFTMQKIDLKDVIKNNQLGVIDNDEPMTILIAAERENPSTWNKLSIYDVDITNNGQGAKISTKKYHGKFTGEVNVFFSVPSVKIDLNQVIKNPQLGELENKEPKTIFAAIEKTNSATLQGLTINDVDIKVNPNGIEAKISAKANNPKFIGKVNVYFSVKPVKTDLKEVVKTIQLGHLKDFMSATILDAIKNQNPSTAKDLTIEDIDINLIKNGSGPITGANIKAKNTSAKFTGQVDVSFTVEKIDLKKVIIITNLGTVSPVSTLDVFNAVKAKNPNTTEYLTYDDVKVDIHSNKTEANIYANKNSALFTGQAFVKFNIDSTKPPTGPQQDFPINPDNLIKFPTSDGTVPSENELFYHPLVNAWFNTGPGKKFGYILELKAIKRTSNITAEIKVAATPLGKAGILYIHCYH